MMTLSFSVHGFDCVVIGLTSAGLPRSAFQEASPLAQGGSQNTPSLPAQILQAMQGLSVASGGSGLEPVRRLSIELNGKLAALGQNFWRILDSSFCLVFSDDWFVCT